ncbi:ATP-NAD kinase-like domain-containing protein [Lipomyces kononenkoae]|uniref:ATP-NAD kinase-like domain-containing protein n=1 Tax=Lipomyces kononenkoae TaxID=34357 RepID=A0ACC3SUW5_LIPKO
MPLPDSIVGYTQADRVRVRLVLEDRFLLLDHAPGYSDQTSAGCLSSISCVSAPSTHALRQNSIVYFNILWAELLPSTLQNQLSVLTIDYCKVKNDKKATLDRVSFLIDAQNERTCEDWIDNLLSKAYRNAVRNKRLLVLINPFGGQGTAMTRYMRDSAPMLAAARCRVYEIETKYKGHASEIVENMEGLEQKYDAIVCCSGDGIPHEVFNGLCKRTNVAAAFKVPVCQLPCGSGNALCHNLVGSNDLPFATLSVIKGIPISVDLCSLTQDNKRYITFLSQALGMIADCDLGTENMRWMGESRFTVGLIMRVLSGAKYPCRVSVRISHESRTQVRQAYQEHKNKDEHMSTSEQSDQLPELKYGTVHDPVPEDWKSIDSSSLAVFYVGKMPWMSSDALFFPAALPRDGYLDMVLIDSSVPKKEIFSILLGVAEGKHFDSKYLHYYKVDAYRIEPKAQSGYISIDGESFNFTPFQVELHPGLGTLLSRTGEFQAPGI